MTESTIKEHIQRYGWRFQYVFDADGVKEDFAYTIGLDESFNHPEVMIFGLKRETMHALLQEIAEAVKGGKAFQPGERYADIVSHGYEVMFKPLKKEFLPEYAGIASDYYNREFRMYVMLWPDKRNILPTEPNCQLTVQDEALKIV